MKHVPKYLLPRIAPAGYDDETNKPKGFVLFKKDSARGRGRGWGRGGGHTGSRQTPPSAH
jgi:ATP-dependent RNA helicase DDX56/DBP9